jgi:cobalt/nickel transport system ATP-binding protein
VNVTEPAFAVDNVSYRYNVIAALRGLSIEIRRGERVALLGANGSGKSTLLRLLAGLQFPDSGQIRYCGEELTEERLHEDGFFYSFRRSVGIVFQNPDVQLFNPTVFDEVAFGPLQLHWSRPEIRARVFETLETMGIAGLADRPPHRLSGGEKKRVAIASVLVLDPEILLLDEPAGALDPGSQSLITGFLSSWSGGSKTVVTATHDLDTLEEIADRCYVFDGGSVAAEGTPLSILHDVPLLERTKLVRPHRHVHEPGTAEPSPHPHIHRHP